MIARLPGRARVVGTLGVTQTLSWASSYYLPAIVSVPMARDLGLPTSAVYAAFSLALVVSALVGPWAGRTIDRSGGRTVLVATNLLFALALVVMSRAQDGWSLAAAWVLMGVAMGAGLYEAAFATVVRLYGQGSRGAITGITLFAGFASTVGWPLSAWLEATQGWRVACLGWAALHLFVALPLNASLPRPGDPAGPRRSDAQERAVQDAAGAAPAALASGGSATFARVVLAGVFAIGWFNSTAMAAHLPRLLEAAGVGLAAAVAAGALIGPAQVAARLAEFGLLRRAHPLLSARLATLAHPIAAATLLLAGAAFAPLFAVLHGAGNGILTIAMATLPLALFGPRGYGARQGWLLFPARMVQAAAPWLFGMTLDRHGADALWLTAFLALLAFAGLMALQPRDPADRGPTAASSPSRRGR
jgi:MFS family permease